MTQKHFVVYLNSYYNDYKLKVPYVIKANIHHILSVSYNSSRMKIKYIRQDVRHLHLVII